MQRCVYRRGEWQCPENTSNGDKCIFHRETPKDTNELERRFSARLADKNEEIARFDGAIFPGGDFFRRTYERSISFNNAIFSAGAIFEGAKFLGQNTSFEGARFSGDANFQGVLFEGERVVFKSVQFPYKTNFGKTKFICEEIDFSNVQFNSNESTIFDEALLNSSVTSFAGAIFNSPKTSFIGTQFRSKKEINFEATRFGFNCKTVFRGTEPGQVFLEGKVNFKNADILEHGEEYEKRKGKLVFEWVNLGQTEFLNTDVSKIRFIDVEWDKRYDFLKFGSWRSRLHDEKIWRENRASQQDREVDNRYLTQLSYLSRTLKKYYTETGEIQLAGHFHYGFMEILLAQEEMSYAQKIKSKLKQKIHKYISWRYWYKKTSGYGEDYAVAATVLFLFIFCFATIYAFMGVPKYYCSWWERILNAIIYSFQAGTLSRVNFYKEEDIILPARLLHVLESIVVPAQFAFFVIALRNRFRR